MKASRLLAIMLSLQVRGRMTARALAEEFEVSVRTVYRDIDQLSAAGVPVYAEKGPGGGFQLLDGYRTRLTGLSEQEAETLFLAGLPGPAAELGLGEAMARTRLKLLAALPLGKRSDAERVGRRFHLDPIGWFQRAEPNEHLRALALAVWRGTAVRMRYESWKAVVERTVEPLGLILKAGIWYLAGRVGEQVRTYRVASILALDVLETTFGHPAEFDLAAYWTAWAGDYERRMQQGEAIVRLSPLGLRELSRESHVLEVALRAAGPPDADGWRRAVVPIESVEHAVGDMLKLRCEVEVLGPAELRAAIVTAARRVLALHANIERSA